MHSACTDWPEELGATLDVSAPALGPFRMIVRLPTRATPATRPTSRRGTTLPPSTARPKLRRHPAFGRPRLRPAARTDRRSNPRVETALPAKITRGSSSWKGTVVNLGVGGARIRMPDGFPPPAPQDAVIRVTTAVATLELADSSR